MRDPFVCAYLASAYTRAMAVSALARIASAAVRSIIQLYEPSILPQSDLAHIANELEKLRLSAETAASKLLAHAERLECTLMLKLGEFLYDLEAVYLDVAGGYGSPADLRLIHQRLMRKWGVKYEHLVRILEEVSKHVPRYKLQGSRLIIEA